MSYFIYKICHMYDSKLIYVGSTKDFDNIMKQHKLNYNNQKKTRLYDAIRENGGWSKWTFCVIEDCGDIEMKDAREIAEDWRQKLNAELNTSKCFRTDDERREHERQYYLKNKDDKLQYQKEWREKNKDKIKEKNEMKKQEMQEYYQKNKDMSKYDICECGRCVFKGRFKSHEKSKYHIRFIEEKNKLINIYEANKS